MNPNYQVHHIFPLEAFRDHGDALERIFGVDNVKSVIQSLNNRIALFPEPGRAEEQITRKCKIVGAW